MQSVTIQSRSEHCFDLTEVVLPSTRELCRQAGRKGAQLAQKLRSLLGERDQKLPCLSFGKSTSLEVLSQTQAVAEPSPSRNGHQGSCRRAQQAGMLGRCGLVEGGYVNPEMNPYNRGQSPHFPGRALQPGRRFSRKVPGSLRVTPKAKPKLCSLLTKHPTSTKGPLVRIATLGVRGGGEGGVKYKFSTIKTTFSRDTQEET